MPAQGGPSALTAADVDGDGIVDLVAAISLDADAIVVLKGQGNGGFTERDRIAVGPLPTRPVVGLSTPMRFSISPWRRRTATRSRC